MQVVALSRPRKLIRYTTAFALSVALCFAFANAETLSEQRMRLIAIYESLLNNPTDVEKTLEYAQLAIQMGDYEAAIPPLERLLITNPDATSVKVELGVLYYQIGATDIARNYFTDAIDDEAAPENLVAEAEAYLEGM